jgi:hypothetical protein
MNALAAAANDPDALELLDCKTSGDPDGFLSH